MPAVLLANIKMAQIHNSTLTKELTEGARLQVARDIIPSQIAEKVVPVMEVNPKLLRVDNIIKQGGFTNDTAGVIYTTPSGNQDFYLTSVALSVIKDATSTSTLSRIRVIVDGVTTYLIPIAHITLTAQNFSYSLTLKNPIKIDRNTSISVITAANVANIACYGSITGYLVDNPNA